MDKISEVEAEKKYQQVLENIIYPLLGKKITFGKDLTRIGIKLFGKNFTGAFPSDMIPKLGVNPDGSIVNNNNINKTSHLYAIANLDDSTMPGSHWISLAYDVDDKRTGDPPGSIWVYDSFGRSTKEIIPSLVQRYGDKLRTVDQDAEQMVSEDDCGARCMAWLYVFDRYGKDTAKLI